jgi:hypothetical protein
VNSEKANVIQVLQMCNTFSELGQEVILAVPDGGYDDKSIEKHIQNKLNKKIQFSVATYPRITVNGRLKMIGGYIGIRKLLKSHHFDFCFVRNPLFINQTIKNKIPTIFESHNALLHENYKVLDFLCKKNLMTSIK